MIIDNDCRLDDLTLIKHLKSIESPFLSKIQEVYDKIKDILNTRVQHVFPNYTLHNTGHSFRIMEYMSKLIQDYEKLNELEITLLIYSALKIIPITKSLLKLLHRMGYETKKGRDEYLLSPDRSKTSAYAIMYNLTKGFSHFYKQLNTGRELHLKSLRKTYLTYLNSALSGDTKKLSSHSTDNILLKHYIDEKVINKAVKNVDIFA